MASQMIVQADCSAWVLPVDDVGAAATMDTTGVAT
jgi:hypothetical protein